VDTNSFSFYGIADRLQSSVRPNIVWGHGQSPREVLSICVLAYVLMHNASPKIAPVFALKESVSIFQSPEKPTQSIVGHFILVSLHSFLLGYVRQGTLFVVILNILSFNYNDGNVFACLAA
jgi:hypothetical protein